MNESMSVVLKNRYWVLRHGKSIPNERGLIVSSMENGTRPEFQLASDGVNQAQLAAKLLQKDRTSRMLIGLGERIGGLFYYRGIRQENAFKELEANNIPVANVRICYSPFSRTTHTASVVATVLNLPFQGPQCKVIQDLRERYFGPSFELFSHDKYEEIWAIDEKDPLLEPEGGESVKDVASRLARVITTIESEFNGFAILVVSHGDPLQILQTITHAANQLKEPTSDDLASRLEAVQVAPILSQHRKYALETGELRRLI